MSEAISIENQKVPATKVFAKEDYKKTKLGWIPEEWEIITLGKATSILTNGFVGKATTHYSKDLDSVLYIQGYNVKENSFNLRGIKKVSKAFNTKNKKSILKENDLLTVQTGDVGLTTIIPKKLAGSNCHALIISRFKEDNYLPQFYSQYFNSHIGRGSLKSIETGSTMKHLNIKDMLKWLIPLPPLPEQQKIVAILFTWDNAIGKQEQLIAAKQHYKKGLMQLLLTGKKRFDGFDEGLELLKLNDIGKIYTGGTPSSEISKYWNGNITWYTPSEIRIAGKFIHRSKRKITTAGLKNSSAKIFPTNSIVICTRATIGEVSISTVPACTNQGFKNIEVSKNHNVEFVYYKLKSAKSLFLRKACGSTFLELSTTDFRNIKFNMPSLAEQQKIASVLSKADIEIVLLQNQLTQLQTQKRGLMQKLLTGAVRVKI